MTIRVLAKVITFPDKLEETKALLMSLIEATRQENGCLRYELWQNQEKPTEFSFVEEWADQAALDAHFQTPHFLDALQKTEKLLMSSPEIVLYQLIK
ncbi:antibiotic biosynthesis monooxygenase [Aphanothece hegewaldii CCALA 016]|uniref:Antibiotic biosynthesis monooxygenase n=1 Tax=Aphanothece hegewaldii CCALA 016 TaxID=2107694 RepID=A0A2T1LTY8_9CHRO|nr:putative quinol monooxygenase [Aphanothece hegewaldii]PSF34573.1 antibiotic biosynthesis monooxygenase [Aphanothece hegewaldii CCALA 016]